MKKALSLLLVLAMLATMTTVPAWAAEDVEFDIPVIEEVTEEELEEVVLFTEEEITEEEVTEGTTDVTNVTWNTFVPAEDDGVTYLTELTGAKVTPINNLNQGNVDSVYNGIYTVGVEIENPETNGLVDHYPTINEKTEGFMTTIYEGGITIDLGAETTFSGVRLVDSHKARAMKARKVSKIFAAISDDGVTWAPLENSATTRDVTDTYGDFAFTYGGNDVNLTAKYIRIWPAAVNNHLQMDIEEVVMIDEDSEKTAVTFEDAFDYYVPSEKWTYSAGSNFGDSKPETAFDGVIFGNQGESWHSATGQTDNEAGRTLTVLFGEDIEVGGVRLFPRTMAAARDGYGGGSSPKYIKLLGTKNNGETWEEILPTTANAHTSGGVKGDSTYLYFGRDNTFNGIKIVTVKNLDNTSDYTCYTEAQILKPISPRGALGDDEVTMGYPIGTAATYVVKEGSADTVKHNTSRGYIIMDGTYITKEWFVEMGSPGGGDSTKQLHHDYCVGDKNGDSVYLYYDMGKEYEFSGVRLYQRVNGNQNFKQGYIYVSDDGENWVPLDKIALSSTPVVTTISGLTFGGNKYNYKARYMKIHCLVGQSKHWAFEEVRLLNPTAGLDTKTPDQLQAEIDDVKTSIAKYSPETVTLADVGTIETIKAKYDALDALHQAQVDGDKVAALYDAAIQLTHTVRVNGNNASSTGSETVHWGNLGYTPVTYKLYVSGNDVKVTGLSWKGEEISADNDNWSSVNNEDGTLSLTLNGCYYDHPVMGKWLDGNVKKSIANGQAYGYYYETTGAIGGFTTTKVKLDEALVSGALVRMITMDEIGDHILTVTLSDGTTKDICLTAEYRWIDVPSTATLGEKDLADGIAPKSTWKIASDLWSVDTVNGAMSKATQQFDGVYDANFWSNTYTSPLTAYDSEGTASSIGNNHIMYTPGGTVWLDLGEETTFSGIRLYDKGKKLNDTEVYGRNSETEEWVKLGEKYNNNAIISTIGFSKNETCRYVKIVLKRFADGAASWTHLNEVVLLKPKTILTSASAVSVDVSEDAAPSFTFDLIADETVSSVKEGEAAVAYTFENNTLTLSNESLSALSNGAHTLTVTFSNGQTFTVNVTKSNTGEVGYKLAGATSASATLTLVNPRGKEITGLAYDDGTELVFTAAEDNSQVTVTRQHLRRAKDLYALTGLDKAGEATLVATFADGDTKEYKIIITNEWVTLTEPTRTDYAADEIKPVAGVWKVMGSSQTGSDTHPYNAFIKPKRGGYQGQNWHTYHGTLPGSSAQVGDSTKEIGHYIDIDFGENNTMPYLGIRHLERNGGTTWNGVVTIWGKNDVNGEWIELHKKVPTYEVIGIYEHTDGKKHNINQADILFDEPVTYRFLRMNIKSAGSEHITANTITVIKPTARLAGDGISYIDDAEAGEDAIFNFKLVELNENVISVAAGETVLAETDYEFDKENGTLTISAEYTKNLGAETAITVTIDGWALDCKIVKVDKFSKTYALTDEAGKGDDALELYAINGDTVTGVKHGETELSKVAVEDGLIKVNRSEFRRLDSEFFLKEGTKVTVTYENAGDVEYDVTFSVYEYTVTDQGGVFASDEITPDYGKWKIKASSTNDTNGPAYMIAKRDHYMNWHSSYVDLQNGGGVDYDNKTGRHYVEVDFGSATKFSGFRYATRGDIASGHWKDVTVYGSNDDGATWEEIHTADILSQLPESRVGIATISFSKNVSYKKVRLQIKAAEVATAKYLTFLAPIKVTVNLTPVGGNVTVGDSETPTFGTDTFEQGEEVTYNAKANEGSSFMYWIEANTGKVLGREEALKIQTTVGKNIKAVFADPPENEAFVTFFGKDGGKVLATGNATIGKTVSEQSGLTVPSAHKLYATGYTFKHWLSKSGIKYTPELLAGVTISETEEFTAVYEKDEELLYTITVVDGTASRGKASYNTTITVTADEAEEGKVFTYWTMDGKIVSYSEVYSFYMPDYNVTVTANYGDAKVEEEITLSMTKSTSVIKDAEGNDVSVAGFIVNRNIPDGANILEVGIIYVKDKYCAADTLYSDSTLTITAVGGKSLNDKDVKVAIAAKNGKDAEGKTFYISGQHKLSASYKEFGIAARGFITYKDGETVKTIYTDTMIVG